MICNKCGNRLPEDSEFCQYCGSRIEKVAVVQEAAPVVEPASIPREEPAAAVQAVMPQWVEKEAPKPMPAPHLQRTIDFSTDHYPHRLEPQVEAPQKAPEAKKSKQPKRKYCSRCGGVIDPQSKRCTGCGKQYFRGIRFKKCSAATIVLSLVIVALMGLNVYQLIIHFRNKEAFYQAQTTAQTLKKENADLNTKVNSQKVTIQIKEDEIASLKNSTDLYELYFDFCFDHVRIIGNDGTNVYHRYACNKLDMSNGFLVLNSEAADYQNYTRCSSCH